MGLFQPSITVRGIFLRNATVALSIVPLVVELVAVASLIVALVCLQATPVLLRLLAILLPLRIGITKFKLVYGISITLKALKSSFLSTKPSLF